MRKMWKGLLISGIAWLVIGLVVMISRGKRQSKSSARKPGRTMAKVVKVSLPLAKAAKPGHIFMSGLRRKG